VLAAALLASASVAPAQAASPLPPAGAEAPLFKGVLLLGSTALPPSEIAPFVAPYVGKPADAALLEQVRLAVSAAHDDAGFGLVSIGTPLMQGSTALIRVQPLSVGRIEVQTGAEGSSAAPASLDVQAAAAFPALRPGVTPDLKALDRQLRLANLQPHRRWAVDFRAADSASAASAPPDARPPSGDTPLVNNQRGQSIAAAKDAPEAVPEIRLPGFIPGLDGVSTVEARVVASSDDPLFGRVLLDNAGQPATGLARLRLQLGHGDLFGPGRSLDLTGLVSIAHPDRQHQLALRYQHPLPRHGTLLSAEFSLSRSRPGVVEEFFEVSGDSKVGSISARRLLARRGALEPFLEAGFELGTYDDVVDFFGENLGSKVGTSPLALALGGSMQGGGWSAFGQFRVRHNLGLGSASGAADYEASRSGATPGWTTFDAFLDARRAIGRGQEAVLRVQGQVTGDALVSPQLFRAGGQSSMRGLLESEMAGDTGIAASFEYWGSLGAGHRLGGLVDTAAAHRNKALAGEIRNSSATSAGVAWQWDAARGLRLTASVAKVLAAKNLPETRKGDTRAQLLLDWAF
jgi:hemolysin activation/secretion protein